MRWSRVIYLIIFNLVLNYYFLNIARAFNIENPLIELDYFPDLTAINQIRVNKNIITKNNIVDYYNLITKLKIFDCSLTKKPQKNNCQNLVINKLIIHELIKQKAAQYNILANDQQLENFIENFLQKKFAAPQMTNIGNFIQYLKKHNLDFGVVKNYFAAEILWFEIINQTIRPSVSFSDIEIDESLEQYSSAQRNYRYLLQTIIITEDELNKTTIDDKYKSLTRNNKFKKFIEKYFFYKFSHKISDLNWYWQYELNPAIHDVIINGEIDEYTSPINIEGKWYIFKIIDKKYEFNIDEKQKNLIVNNIIAKKLNIAAQNFLSDLYRKSTIEIK